MNSTRDIPATLVPAKAAFIYPPPSRIAPNLSAGQRVSFTLCDWHRGETTIDGAITKPLGGNGCVGVRAIVAEGEPEALYIVPVAAVTTLEAAEAA